MKTALRIVALVLLTVLCVLLVWNVVEHCKTTVKYFELYSRITSCNDEIKHLETYKNSLKSCTNSILQGILRISYSLFAIFAAIYFEIKTIHRIYIDNTTLAAKATIITETLSLRIQQIEAKREELLRLKKEKKIAKLQQKLNKIKESE